jgi:hypothetical protein
MSSTSENTFGSKLRNGQDLSNYILGFTAYTPPRTQESAAAMATLLTSIVTANNTAANNQQQYRTAVKARQTAYAGANGSIVKLLPNINGAVEAQYGKTSVEAKSIAAQIKSMRAKKLVKLPADPTKQAQEKTISQSERSYGSMLQAFNNIVASLQQFTGYNPSNTNLRVAALQATSTQVTTLNNSVAQKIQALKTAKSSRDNLYLDLKDRAQRIKSYVKAQYGVTSNEYTLIKGLKI